MITDDDGDDVAIDEGMEPESPDGSDTGGDDDYDDGDDGIAAGGAISRTIEAPRGTRPISAKTRELAKKIAASKPTADESDLPGDDDIDYEENPHGSKITAPPSGEQAAADAAGAAATPQNPPPGGGPPIPPAPALDPEVTKLREEWTAKARELEERERTLLEREQSGDLAQLADQYFERGAPAIVEILKKWEGVEGEALNDALADLVSDLTIHMGVEVPQEVKDRLEAKRTRKQVQRMRSEQSRAQQEAAKRAEAAQDQENRVRVKGILQQEITKPEHAQSYPWLAVEPNAGEIIFDVIDAAIRKDGTKLTWQEAAKRANDYLQNQSRTWYDARRHLLTTAPAQGNAGSGKQRSTQGGQQVRRSQAPPQDAPPESPPAPAPTGKWDAEAHRRAIKAKHGPKLRAAFQAPNEE